MWSPITPAVEGGLKGRVGSSWPLGAEASLSFWVIQYYSHSYLRSLHYFFLPRARALVGGTLDIHLHNTRILGMFVSIRPMGFGGNCCSYSLAFFFLLSFSLCASPDAYPRMVGKVTSFGGGIVLCNDYNTIGAFSGILNRRYRGRDTGAISKDGAPGYIMDTISPIPLSTEVNIVGSYCRSSYYVPSYIYRTLNNRILASIPHNAPAVCTAVNLFAMIRLVHGIRVLVPVCSFYIPRGSYSRSATRPYSAFDHVGFPLSSFFPPHPSDVSGRASYNYVKSVARWRGGKRSGFWGFSSPLGWRFSGSFGS